jgi:hypothetical protein
MKFVKITFSYGYQIKTGFNGTLEQAKKYYLDRFFEVDEDRPFVKVVSVEEIV